MKVWAVRHLDDNEDEALPIAAPTSSRARYLGALEFEEDYFDMRARAGGGEIDTPVARILTDAEAQALGWLVGYDDHP